MLLTILFFLCAVALGAVYGHCLIAAKQSLLRYMRIIIGARLLFFVAAWYAVILLSSPLVSILILITFIATIWWTLSRYNLAAR